MAACSASVATCSAFAAFSRSTSAVASASSNGGPASESGSAACVSSDGVGSVPALPVPAPVVSDCSVVAVDGSDVADSKRNANAASTGRESEVAKSGRNAGNAANTRNASKDHLGRSFATARSVPRCSKVKDSCSIEILGFHPKANIEYFDRIESIKAKDMVIVF